MERVQSKLLLDRISNLPDNVTDIILMCLPTRDAVRTSILSRNWRHVWAKIPIFVLDETLWKNVSKQHSAETILTKILCHLFSRHDGPIEEFLLSNPDLNSRPEIDDLIFFLAKNHVEYFTLEMWKDCYILPDSFFLCQKLIELQLRLCSIRSSPTNEVFSMLTTMVLIEVTLSAKTLESLISGCPLLHYLEMECCSEVDICIDAPSLKSFFFFGDTTSINFKRVPLLAHVSIIQKESQETINFVGAERDIVKFFHLLPVIETLILDYTSVQRFEGILHRGLPTLLIYLKELSLYSISFNEIDELLFTLCLLRSSPNLKFICIQFEDYAGSNSKTTATFMEGEDYSDICLSELLEVVLKGVTGTKPELEFIRLLLAKSSSLRELKIEAIERGVDNGFKIVKEVLKFRRVSKEAEITFQE